MRVPGSCLYKEKVRRELVLPDIGSSGKTSFPRLPADGGDTTKAGEGRGRRGEPGRKDAEAKEDREALRPLIRLSCRFEEERFLSFFKKQFQAVFVEENSNSARCLQVH